MYDIVAIYETWCENVRDIECVENKLPGYKCYIKPAIRVHKHGRPSGGTAVYVKLGPKASMCRELNWVEVGEGDG